MSNRNDDGIMLQKFRLYELSAALEKAMQQSGRNPAAEIRARLKRSLIQDGFLTEEEYKKE